MWEHSYFTEKTPVNSARHGLFLLELGKIDESFKIGFEVEKWNPKVFFLPKLISHSISLKKDISTEEKISFLKKRIPLSPWYAYCTSILYASMNFFDEADMLLRSEIEMRLPALIILMQEEIEKIAVAAEAFCTYSKKKNYYNLREKIKSSSTTTLHEWNESAYHYFLAEFGIH